MPEESTRNIRFAASPILKVCTRNSESGSSGFLARRAYAAYSHMAAAPSPIINKERLPLCRFSAASSSP